MCRYECKSKLNISCRTNVGGRNGTHLITIWLEHHKRHTSYYDVSLPSEAAEMIWDNLDWTCPNDIAKKVQMAYPTVSAGQIYNAWTTMSETLWKRSQEQLPSVKALLGDFKADVDTLSLPEMEGVVQVAWVMKKVVLPLRNKVVEVGIDATCKQSSAITNDMLTIYILDNTNSKHLELYTILGKYDNTGFPLSYCLLTTASSVKVRKRTRALEAWATVLCDRYGINPRFVHTDKDMAEIGASRRVWPYAKHQLCWWHQREAIRRRLKGNLPTSIYNSQRAKNEHKFINLNFRPYGRADPNDVEGNVPEEDHEQEMHDKHIPPTGDDPNSIKIRIPVRLTSSIQDAGYSADKSPLTNAGLSLRLRIPMRSPRDIQAAGIQEAAYNAHLPVQVVEPTLCPDTSRLTIRIPALASHEAGAATEDELDEETSNARRTFCPIEYRASVVEMVERHFCVHPDIPGYSTPTPKGIKAWAVRQVWEFCLHRDLPNLWAYLWENWYRRGRWELWARSGNPEEIPCLKTTMFVEGQ